MGLATETVSTPYEHTHTDGNVYNAESVEDAMSKCTGFLGKVSVEVATMMLEVEALGKQKLQEEQIPVRQEQSEQHRTTTVEKSIPKGLEEAISVTPELPQQHIAAEEQISLESIINPAETVLHVPEERLQMEEIITEPQAIAATENTVNLVTAQPEIKKKELVMDDPVVQIKSEASTVETIEAPAPSNPELNVPEQITLTTHTEQEEPQVYQQPVLTETPEQVAVGQESEPEELSTEIDQLPVLDFTEPLDNLDHTELTAEEELEAIISTTISELLNELPEPEKEVAETLLQDITQIVQTIELLQEQEAVPESETAQAELEELVVTLFEQLGLDPAPEEVQAFMRAILQPESKLLAELSTPLDAIDLEHIGTHEAKHGFGQLVGSVTYDVKRLIGMFVLLQATT